MIKMKIENDENSKCDECSTPFKNTEEMYCIMIFNLKNNMCKNCCDQLFRKLLKASCMYDGKVKSKEDLIRQERAKRYRINAEKKL